MKNRHLINQIFNTEPLSEAFIETGLTNKNYVITLEQETVVLRVPNAQGQTLFDYEHESHVLDMIKPLDLDTPLLYYNKQTGVKCSTYIPNTSTFEEKYIERAAKLIQKLHGLKKESGKRFDLEATLSLYRAHITAPYYDLSAYDSYISNLSFNNITLCHNDLVKGNFLFSDSKDYLIDYEYAKDNDPLFDVMSFITENDIVDPKLRNRFYTVYFGHAVDGELLHRLNQFEIAHHIIWCTWAMMMSESDPNPEYISIRDLKYTRLMEVLKREEHSNGT